MAWLVALFCVFTFQTTLAAVEDRIQIHPLPPHMLSALQAADLADGFEPVPAPEVIVEALQRALAGSGNVRVTEGEQDKPAWPGQHNGALGAPAFPGEIILNPTARTPREIRVEQPEGLLSRNHRQGRQLSEEEARPLDARTAADFLQTYSTILRLDNPSAEKKLVRHFTDDLGKTHLRYDQYYQGVPVWPGQWQVSLDQGGRVERFSGAFVPTPKRVVMQPTVDRDRALGTAMRAVAHVQPMARGQDGEDGENETVDAELIVYAPGDRPERLAWKFTLELSLTQVWRVIVDAHADLVLDAYNIVPNSAVEVTGTGVLGDQLTVKAWFENEKYVLHDRTKSMYDPGKEEGVIATVDARNVFLDQPGFTAYEVEASSPTGPWLPDGISLHHNLSLTYDYFLEKHNWTSLDNKGHNVLALARLGDKMANAFWFPSLKILGFGDGQPYAADLTVVAHEFTHGVTTFTSNLEYRDQSGAINEAMSDIFAVAADAWVNNRINWNYGYISDAEKGGTRSLSNPGSFEVLGYAYPSRMSEYFHRNHPLLQRLVNQDYGGVHINNMIVSHAFYHLAEGLPAAIGIEKAARIFFRANTVHLLVNSQFVDARLACIRSAEELFGANSPEAQAAGAAFDVVEIFGGQPTPDVPPDIPDVPGMDSDLFLYFNTDFQTYYLARRETALGDPVTGVHFARLATAVIRPSVSRDGSLACYVSTDRDLVLQRTDNSGEFAQLNRQDIYSVAMSPDATKIAMVFLKQGKASNGIAVYDIETDTLTEYMLRSQAIDGPPVDNIQFAEIMTFSADGRILFYDAFSVFRKSDGSQIGAWALYALNLASGETFTLASNVDGLQIGNPALANTTSGILVLDVYDVGTNVNAIVALNLMDGKAHPIQQTHNMVAVPAFTGDDSGVVFSLRNTQNLTVSSMVIQPLANDRLTPQGDARVYLAEGFAGIIYRRGTYVAPNPRVDLSAESLSFGEVAVGQSRQETVTITNGGYGTLNIVELAVSGPDSGSFSLTGNCIGASLQRNASCAMLTTFTPTGPGTMTGTVMVRTNDPVQADKPLSLSGIGQATQQTGSLRITITPPEAAAAGAMWRRKGTMDWFASGATESDIAVDTYEIEFKPVPGWRPPGNVTVTVQAGTTQTSVSAYSEQGGVLPGVLMLLLDEVEKQ